MTSFLYPRLEDNMKYFPCDRCRRRMVKLHADQDDGRRFYACRRCGFTVTFQPGPNGGCSGWPADAIEEMRQRGVLDEEGRPLLERASVDG